VTAMPIDDETKKILREGDKPRTPNHILKLPCGHGSVEIKEARDQDVRCPQCHEVFYLSWSMTKKVLYAK